MYYTDTVAVPGMLGTSVLIIVWWVSIWILIEEAIEYISGDKRHVKLYVCVILIVVISLYVNMYPVIADKL
jgi:hypothetical protein